METSNENKVNKTIESKSEVVELNENQHADVSGGYILNAGKSGMIRSKPFEVIDDVNGKVLGRYASRREAEKMAGKKGQSSEEINWGDLEYLRRIASD